MESHWIQKKATVTKVVHFISVYALKFKSCLNLESHENTHKPFGTIGYKVPSYPLSFFFKKNNDFNIVSSLILRCNKKWSKWHIFSSFFEKRKMCPQLSLTTRCIVSEFLSSDLKPHFLVNFKWLSMSGSRREQVTYILKNAMRLKKIKIFCWS